MIKAKVNEKRQVLCHACDKPILMKHLGGVANVNGQEAFFHNSLLCLMALADATKPEPVKTGQCDRCHYPAMLYEIVTSQNGIRRLCYGCRSIEQEVQ